MTQEDKELLFRDLSARIPYGVMCNVSDLIGEHTSITEPLTCGVLSAFIRGEFGVKPYLRPMSSMTEEEKTEYDVEYAYNRHTFGYEEYLSKMLDWLNRHYFDYRGLIEKGLALVAPVGMYCN